MSGYAWSAVQSEVAKFRSACWYDRPSYGWSDPAPMPRTFRSVASDLHKLLHAAAVPPPYVFIGGGDAALHIRVYHGLYPNEVAGVLMVDANDVDIRQTNLPEAAKGAWAKHFGSFAPRARGAACSVFPVINTVGLGHLAGAFQSLRHTDSIGLTQQQQAELDFLSDNPTAQGGSELCAREENMEQVRAARDLGAVPLEVIASRRLVSEPNLAERAIAVVWEQRRIERIQPALARLSSRSRLIIADGGVDAKTISQAVRAVIEAPKGR
jgi:pimeloyl-ACP methyl ester carboxylesterase